MHKIIKPWLFVALAMLAMSPFLTAQERPLEGTLDNKIPIDPNIRKGVLENGLTYYIRKNTKPEQKAELRLVVNVGSISEDDDQQGLAHFTEHMAFNGTKNFKKNDLVSYLQSIGVEFGADLNAYTSFDETVYILPIPTDDKEIMDKGFQILEDWAHNVELTDEEIDKERGVVIEEWRLGQGANQRMRDEYFPILFKGSRYAERLPIGKKDILENFDYEVLRRFYKEWYRPNLMSVVVVGDVDPDEIEEKIKSHFAKLTNPKNAREREMYPVPDHEESYIAITSDKETPYTMVQLIYKTENEKTETVGEYRRDIVHMVYNGMINNRLAELAQSGEPPFVFGSTSYGSMVRTKSNYSSMAIVGGEGITNGLKALITENERVKKFGFTKGELSRYKEQMLTNYEKAFNERDKTESRNYAGEYIRNFLTDEPIPGIEFEFDILKNALPTIELEEVNALAAKWITDENRVVVIAAPEKEGVPLPKEEDIAAVLKGAETMELTAYEDISAGSELLETIPTPGKVASETFNETVGATTLVLSNGLKIVLKPTDFKNDEILMRAYSLGGHSVYSDEDYQSAANSDGIVGASGLGDYTVADLQKLLAGNTANASPFIGALTEGMNGSSSPKDLETLLQLTHLYFTNPKKDENGYKSYVAKNKMLFQNLMSNPNFYYSDQVSRIMSQNHPRAGGFPTAEDLDKITFETSYKIFRERFANAGDFNFFFIGNFNIEEIKPLLETYLGSLPGGDSQEKWVDLGIRAPKGVVKKTLNKGADQKSQVTIRFTGEADYSDKIASYHLSSLGEFLSIRLVEILREEISGVYGVGARGSTSKFPIQTYNFNIGFPCGPDNVEKLIDATFAEIAKIKKDGLTEEDVLKITETQRRQRLINLKENRYWLNQLYAYDYYGSSYDTFFEREKMIEDLKPKDIQEAAKRYLDLENYIQVVLMPEQ